MQDALGRRTTTVYDEVGNAVARVDALNRRTTTVFDELQRAVANVDALGNRATSIYDAVGQVTASVDALGRRTTAVFDAVGNVVEMQDALGNRTTSVFDAANRQIASVDALGRRTTTVFDVRGQVEAMVDGLGTFTQNVFDANGNTLASIDALGNRTTSVYDELNRAYAQVDALGNRTTSVFDAVGNRTASIDALGRRTTFNYDAMNRIITKTDALNGVESYTFDSRGNRTSLTDPVGNTTTWVYDSLNRVTTETDPLGANKTFAYDEIGKLISQTDRVGKRRDFGYDAVDRRTSEVWVTSGTAVQTQTWNYDAAHQLLSTSDPDGTYTYTYDDAGRVSTVQQPFSLTLTFQYDAVGNRTRVQDSKGGTTTITFDTRNRQTVEELGGSGITGVKQTRTYTLNDQLATATRETYTMGMWQTAGTSTYSYDALDRTTGITHKNNMGMAIATYVYAYDAENRLTSEVLNGTTRTYSYDNTNQLTSDAGTAYSYDANGNRNMSGYSTGVGNRISTDGVRTYTHDANGNVTQTTVGANGETWVYGYDHRNQLLTAAYSATSGGAVTKRVTFAYDSYGNKISREAWDGTTTTTERYGHDGWDTAKPAPIGNENFDVWVDLDGSNTLTTRRMYGPEFDGLTLRENAAGDVGWYLTDRLGSVRGITNGSGTPLTTLTYNAWGEVLTNSTPAQSDSRTYTGRIADTLIGGYDYRDRWFLHSRFLQQDFEGFTPGDANLFRYVGNGPTNATDPSGKWLWVRQGDEGPWVEYLNSKGLKARAVKNDSVTWVGSRPRMVIMVENRAALRDWAKNAPNEWEMRVANALLSTEKSPADTSLNLMANKNWRIDRWELNDSDYEFGQKEYFLSIDGAKYNQQAAKDLTPTQQQRLPQYRSWTDEGLDAVLQQVIKKYPDDKELIVRALAVGLKIDADDLTLTSDRYKGNMAASPPRITLDSKHLLNTPRTVEWAADALHDALHEYLKPNRVTRFLDGVGRICMSEYIKHADVDPEFKSWLENHLIEQDTLNRLGVNTVISSGKDIVINNTVGAVLVIPTLQAASRLAGKGVKAARKAVADEFLMLGRRGGAVVDDAQFLHHQKIFKELGVDLTRSSSLRGELQLTTRQAAAFRPPKTAKNPTDLPQLVVRDDATWFEFMHEYFHYEYYKLNPAKCMQELAKGNRLPSEQYVYDSFRKGILWKELSPAEQKKSIEYITSYGGTP